MPTIYELVELHEDSFGDNGGYPIETTLGYYSCEQKAEEAWIRFKKKNPDMISDVKSLDSDRIGYDIYKLVADDRDCF